MAVAVLIPLAIGTNLKIMNPTKFVSRFDRKETNRMIDVLVSTHLSVSFMSKINQINDGRLLNPGGRLVLSRFFSFQIGQKWPNLRSE